MQSRNSWILITLILCVGCSKDASTQSDQTRDVEQEYASLKLALEEGDGATAATLVTASTLEEYETCRKLALNSSGTDFADLNQLSVLLVFQIRYLFSKAQLEEMTGREVFESGVAEGLIKKNTLAAIDVHKVQYDGATAHATLTKNGDVVTDAMFTFEQEGGRWKLDLMEISRLGGNQLDEVRKRAGKTKVELAVFLLERTHGKSIPPSILDGPLN